MNYNSHNPIKNANNNRQIVYHKYRRPYILYTQNQVNIRQSWLTIINTDPVLCTPWKNTIFKTKKNSTPIGNVLNCHTSPTERRGINFYDPPSNHRILPLAIENPKQSLLHYNKFSITFKFSNLQFAPVNLSRSSFTIKLAITSFTSNLPSNRTLNKDQKHYNNKSVAIKFLQSQSKDFTLYFSPVFLSFFFVFVNSNPYVHYQNASPNSWTHWGTSLLKSVAQLIH